MRWAGVLFFLSLLNKNTMSKDLNLKQEMPPIHVGQVLYIELPKKNCPTEIVEVVVGKIGRKYLYVEGIYERYPIDKETLRHTDHNYSQNNFQLYRDKQEILDRNERIKLLDSLQKHFSWTWGNKNTLEELRQVADILGLP